ncbi:hypothetical protein ACQEVF_23690 [Nonomuraea polychroma]|uniref:hypothetical protein n=1 Tax=Nonomuraea polychroma TaxID=46176 RepID=UPI003D92D1BE
MAQAQAALVYGILGAAWALGIPLGVSQEFLAEGEDGLWLFGAYLATFGAFGGVLTLGLTQRWGEVFPRWLPVLSGRPVPPLLAVVPAGFVSIIITVAGLTYVRWTIAGRFALAEWGAWLPECFWPIRGAALATATVSYHQRRKTDLSPALRRPRRSYRQWRYAGRCSRRRTHGRARRMR